MDVINTIGRRKASVARVYMSEGKGTITVNNRPLEKYFASPEWWCRLWFYHRPHSLRCAALAAGLAIG